MSAALPHSTEAEQGVLSSMMLSADAIAECVRKIGAPYFHVPAHKTIYSALVEAWNDGKAIDLIAFTQTLRDRNLLDALGGPSFITSLYTFVPSAANLSYYLDIVREKYLLREMIACCRHGQTRAEEGGGDPVELLTELQTALIALSDNRTREALTARELVQQAVEELEDACLSRGASVGLSTGLIDLDAMAGGMVAGQLIIVAADTAKGKTTLALNIVEHVALALAKPCGIVSLEMGGVELMNRLIASSAQVDLHTMIRTGGNEVDFSRVTQATGKLANAPLFIRDDSDVDAIKLRGIGRQLKHENAIELLVVDYVQLLTPANVKDENRERAMATAAHALKQMAKELNIVVIALSQVNESGMLRESRAIGHHADKVIKITHDEDEKGVAFLNLDKNRGGPTGSVPVTFLAKFTKFVNEADGKKWTGWQDDRIDRWGDEVTMAF